jgi:LGFP repeat-containing protein
MADPLLDYRFEDPEVANPDGSFPVSFSDVSVVAGPSSTPLGPLPKALNLGPAGRAVVDLTGLGPGLRRFCIRTVFCANPPVNGSQKLLVSSLLPFALSLRGGGPSGDFDLVGSVAPRTHGWNGPDTRFKKNLHVGTWYTVDLAYDTDTAALFLDGACVAVHAFPDGWIEDAGGSELFVGMAVDGASEHFDGALAALQWHDDLPKDVEAALNERRTTPEWFVTYKRESIRDRLDFGERTAKLTFTPSAGRSHVQRYERGAILYHDGAGAAFEIHGAIHDLYFSSSKLRAGLGYLVSDEIDTTERGGRKSLFSGGGIYWSPDTGAMPVTGEVYLHFEAIGESGEIGFPTHQAEAVPGGREQRFQRARMYSKNKTAAFVVRGAILDRFLSTGGSSRWGFPMTDELDITKHGRVIGRLANFELCTFYWSSETGAHEVHGDLRRKYLDLGGAKGVLGFPTSDEADIPALGGPARCNTFKNGSLLWFGSWDSIVAASPFQVFLGRIDSKEEEGAFQGQNDIYLWVTLQEGASILHSERWPRSGHRDGHNVVEPQLTLPPVVTPNDPARSLTLTVDAWDYDDGGGGGDDHLGRWTKTLNSANGWGFRDSGGPFDSGSFAKINSITGSVKRVVDLASLSEVEKWWGVKNASTKTLSHAQYARAFRDVDSESELWDLTDWVQKAFFELVIRGIADGGNCFGMSLEAIYARKGASVFGQPLNEFKNWSIVSDEFNVKHQYQVGADAVWWFVDEVLTGNTGNPKQVFNRSHEASEAGNDPVLCLAQNRDFSGAPHVVLPVGWDPDSKPWTIAVLDPNFPGETRAITVDPDGNRFSYSGGNQYEGGEWDGGRLYFLPFSLLKQRPRTPVWDAILLILGGTVVILGGDGQTERLADPRGRDLDVLGGEATKLLATGSPADDCFVSFKGSGVEGKGPVAGELLLRRRRAEGRSEHEGDLADDEQILHASDPRDFVHTVTGLRKGGKLRYVVKQGLTEYGLHSTLQVGERVQVQTSALGSSAGEIRIASERDKRVRLVVRNRLGIRDDYVSLTLDGIPVSAAEELRLSPKPGIAGIELVGQVAGREAALAVEGLLDGRRFGGRFAVPLEKGVKLKPSTVVTQGLLGVAGISHLFGDAVGGSLIEPA